MKTHGRMICVYLCRVKCEISLQPTMKYWSILNFGFPKLRAPQLDHNTTTYTVSTWTAPLSPLWDLGGQESCEHEAHIVCCAMIHKGLCL